MVPLACVSGFVLQPHSGNKVENPTAYVYSTHSHLICMTSLAGTIIYLPFTDKATEIARLKILSDFREQMICQGHDITSNGQFPVSSGPSAWGGGRMVLDRTRFRILLAMQKISSPPQIQHTPSNRVDNRGRKVAYLSHAHLFPFSPYLEMSPDFRSGLLMAAGSL